MNPATSSSLLRQEGQPFAYLGQSVLGKEVPLVEGGTLRPRRPLPRGCEREGDSCQTQYPWKMEAADSGLGHSQHLHPCPVILSEKGTMANE